MVWFMLTCHHDAQSHVLGHELDHDPSLAPLVGLDHDRGPSLWLETEGARTCQLAWEKVSLTNYVEEVTVFSWEI